MPVATWVVTSAINTWLVVWRAVAELLERDAWIPMGSLAIAVVAPSRPVGTGDAQRRALPAGISISMSV